MPLKSVVYRLLIYKENSTNCYFSIYLLGWETLDIDLSLQSEDHAIASNINVVVRDISLETDDYDFSIWDTDLKRMFYEMEVGGRQYGLDIKVIDYGKTMVAGHEALWYHQVDGSIFTMVYDIKVNQYYYHLAYAMPIAAKERLMPVWYRFINQLKFMNK